MISLNGVKTIIGTVGWMMCEGGKQAAPEYSAALELVQNLVFIPLGVWGIAHKIQKSGVNPQ